MRVDLKTHKLTDETFTVADGCLFVVAAWGEKVGVDPKPVENLGAFMQRVGARASVPAAMKAEGLPK